MEPASVSQRPDAMSKLRLDRFVSDTIQIISSPSRWSAGPGAVSFDADCAFGRTDHGRRKRGRGCVPSVDESHLSSHLLFNNITYYCTIQIMGSAQKRIALNSRRHSLPSGRQINWVQHGPTASRPAAARPVSPPPNRRGTSPQKC